jgi:hypothetical protein
MKKLFKLLSAVAFVFLLSFTLSSFMSTTHVVENNGVDVEVIKNGNRWVLIGCDDGTTVYPTSSTQQLKNGVLHMTTFIFDVPQECDEWPKKTMKGEIWEGARYIYTPSGKYIIKEIYNN